MEENRNENEQMEQMEGSESHAGLWVAICAFVVLAAAGVALTYYNYQQKATIGELTGQAAQTSATIGQLQTQLQDATAKLNDLSAAQAAAAQAAKSGASTAAGTSRAEANRLRQLQAGLEDQKKQLKATQDDVDKTRTDLEGNIGSTRDELNGSIAKTHDELVLLEKRGERDYFEFDATKSKKFQHTGPLNISLRRTDPKHANLDLMVLVNDREISKKKVNLYEPIWIYEDKDTQPVQVVVNKIESNKVHGYISAPKYSPADLAASSASGGSTTTVSPGANAGAPDNSNNE